MSNLAFLAPARRWDEIQQIAYAVRNILVKQGLPDVPAFPVMEFVEFILPKLLPEFSVFAGDHSTMEGAEGLAAPDGSHIEIREDVMRKAWAGEGRARFTVAHELGHLFLHSNQKLQRAPSSAIAYFRNSEKQADHFAASLLMPHTMISADDTCETLVMRFGVSSIAAEIRLKYLTKKGLITTTAPKNGGCCM